MVNATLIREKYCGIISSDESGDGPWFEYHVDSLPDGVRGILPNGGYPSMLREVACPISVPEADADVLKLLPDLLVSSTPQLHACLRKQVKDADAKLDAALLRCEMGCTAETAGEAQAQTCGKA